MTFDHVKSGSVNTFIYGDHINRVRNTQFDRSIMNACKSVRNEMIKYISENPLPDIINNATTYYRHPDYALYLNKEVMAIDINACYWNILHNNKMISDTIYRRYLNNKRARLIAVGNLYKKTFVNKYVYGKLSERNILENELGFGWLFVVSETYKIFLECNRITDNNIIKFKTDCFYVLPEYSKMIIDYITSCGLSCKQEVKTLTER